MAISKDIVLLLESTNPGPEWKASRPSNIAMLLKQYREIGEFLMNNSLLKTLVPGDPSSMLRHFWKKIEQKPLKPSSHNIFEERISSLKENIEYFRSAKLPITILNLPCPLDHEFTGFEDFLTRVEEYVKMEKTPSDAKSSINRALKSEFYEKITGGIARRHREIRQALQELLEGLVREGLNALLEGAHCERILSFAMCTHGRLGESCESLQKMDEDVLRMISHELVR
jgi:hypothetical protein